MNLKTFFDNVRDSVFGGSLSQDQVDGCQRIIAYRDSHWPKMVDAELAYLLASAEWETGHSLQPVEEGFPLRGDALRNYQTKLRYYPWYGRGLIQITWKANYEKFGIEKPEDALSWDVALRVMFEGCIKGMFTGHKLADYISAKRQDYVNARRVVNGLDKAEHIAKNARAFHAALLKASAADVVSKPMPELLPVPAPALIPAGPSMWDRIAEALDKLGAQPPATAPVPVKKPSPAPVATPSPDLLSVANRIEARQLEMLELLKSLAADVAALKASVEQLRTAKTDLRAALVAKEAELVAARDSMTPEQQAVFDSLKAEISATMQLANEAAAA
jgi:putative chitinase